MQIMHSTVTRESWRCRVESGAFLLFHGDSWEGKAEVEVYQRSLKAKKSSSRRRGREGKAEIS